jgi:putative exosortase-associated protein (TIGR04073 family)
MTKMSTVDRIPNQGGSMRLKPVAAAAALVMALSPMALAYEKRPTDVAHDDPMAGATRKLGRGLANTTLGWVELFKGMESVGQEKGFWAGATWGPLYGALNAVKRTAVGVGETLTFPAPGPNHYEPVLEPEFVLEDPYQD